MHASAPIKIIDLTHALEPHIPAWDLGCGFVQTIKVDYSECSSDVKFRINRIEMDAGIGTHIDAPAHCMPSGCTVDRLPLENFLAPCIVIDLSEIAHESYLASPQDILSFEKRYGIIGSGSFVIFRTGWERYWHDPEKYRNGHRFPSISKEAAELLLERDIVGIGIDTLSPDTEESGYPVHAALLGAGKYIIENVANVQRLPARGSLILALPMKIKDGTEAPVRLVAFLQGGV